VQGTTNARLSYANGYKSKRIDTPAGTADVAVPKTVGHGAEPFFPQSLERGCRSVCAVMLAVAEMYVKGVSTRQAEAVLREFGIEGLSSSQSAAPRPCSTTNWKRGALVRSARSAT
jgi:putative transposase